MKSGQGDFVLADPTVKLLITIDQADIDAQQLDELTHYLLRDLRALGVESIERPSNENIPEGAKGEPFTLGILALAVMPNLVPKLVEFLQSWTLQKENCAVKIKTPAGLEIEFTPEKRLTQAELISLVERFSNISSTSSPKDAGKPPE
jgi:hypothetical protein